MSTCPFLLRAGAAILVFACGGCTRPTGTVSLADPEVESPPLLVSELADVGSLPVRIDPPLVFRNPSGEETRLTLTGKGCSCYGLTTEAGEWKPEQALSVPGEGQRQFEFLAQIPPARADHRFRAEFQAEQNGVAVTLQAAARLRIFDDLEVDPGVLTFDVARPPESNAESASDGWMQRFEVRRTTRGRPLDVEPPEFDGLPPWALAGDWTPPGEPEQAAEGLWRLRWEGMIRVRNPPEDVSDGVRRTVRLTFPADDAPPVAAAALPIGEPSPRSAMTDAAAHDARRLTDLLTSRPPREASLELRIVRRQGIVAPGSVHFGVLRPGQSRTRRLVLTAVDGLAFRLSATDPIEGVQVEMSEAGAAPQHWVTVTLTPSEGARGDIRETLLLSTDHPHHPRVSITLRGLAAE
ncbi:MAG: hypothetical protein KF774_10095 [Planctomyces sp.]|nr:hypothetical protein [Planctomyces sp.]